MKSPDRCVGTPYIRFRMDPVIFDSLMFAISCFASTKSSSSTSDDGKGASMSSSLIITACPNFELHSRSKV